MKAFNYKLYSHAITRAIYEKSYVSDSKHQYEHLDYLRVKIRAIKRIEPCHLKLLNIFLENHAFLEALTSEGENE